MNASSPRLTLASALLLAAPAFALARAAEAPAVPRSQASADKLRQLYFEGKLDELEKECDALLAADPADIEARITLANVFRKRGVDADAEWEGRTLGPGQSLPGGDALGRAAAELKTVLQTAPERRDVWFGLCQIEQERRDVAGAASCAASSLDRFSEDPDLPGDLLVNTRPFIERNEYADAVTALEPVAKAKPKHRDVQLAWGRALFLAGRREEGLEALSKLSDLLPEDPELQYQRAEMTAFQGDYAAAGLLFARASKLKARGGMAHLGVIATAHVFDTGGATQLLRGTLNRWKNEHDRMNDALPTVQALMRRFDGVLTARPPSAQDTFLFAQELSLAGCPAAALAETVAALRLDPNLADAHVLQAGLRAEMEQHDLALAALNLALKAIDENRERPFGVSRDEVVLAIGHEQFRLGRFDEALASYRKLTRPDEHAWDAAMAAERLGHFDEAARLLKRVVETGINPAEAEQARRRLASPPYVKAH